MNLEKMFQLNPQNGTLIIQVPFLRGSIQPEAPVFAATGDLTVRLASGRREFMRSQMLRYEVFHREFQGKKFPLGIDRDPFDTHAKHLLVLEGAKKVVGTYRLILGDEVQSFYSHSEFDLSPLNALPGKKMELSRACIHRDYRSGRVLNLLWRGIAGFANAASARWLIGIPSIKTSDPFAAAALYRTFAEKGWLHEDFDLAPRPEYRMVGFEEAMLADRHCQKGHPSVSIPPLMISYFKAGAKVLGKPAYDPAFQCIDFPIALDLHNIDGRFRRKYVDA